MSIKIVKKISLILLFYFIFGISNAEENLKQLGKFKDWESFVLVQGESKICFAQSIPVLQAPKNNLRAARLFVTFRKDEKIQDEVSVTAGYMFNKKNKIKAKSGKNTYIFSTVQENFAWFLQNKTEKKLIKILKKGSRLMVTGYNKEGSQTIDHYSLLGFTKAYNAAKKSCS